MANSKLSALAKCPYYKTYTMRSITCQWLRGRELCQRFDLEGIREKYMCKYCCTMQYGQCPFASLMDRHLGAPAARRVRQAHVPAREISFLEGAGG